MGSATKVLERGPERRPFGWGSHRVPDTTLREGTLEYSTIARGEQAGSPLPTGLPLGVSFQKQATQRRVCVTIISQGLAGRAEGKRRRIVRSLARNMRNAPCQGGQYPCQYPADATEGGKVGEPVSSGRFELPTCGLGILHSVHSNHTHRDRRRAAKKASCRFPTPPRVCGLRNRHCT